MYNVDNIMNWQNSTCITNQDAKSTIRIKYFRCKRTTIRLRWIDLDIKYQLELSIRVREHCEDL